MLQRLVDSNLLQRWKTIWTQNTVSQRGELKLFSVIKKHEEVEEGVQRQWSRAAGFSSPCHDVKMSCGEGERRWSVWNKTGSLQLWCCCCCYRSADPRGTVEPSWNTNTASLASTVCLQGNNVWSRGRMIHRQRPLLTPLTSVFSLHFSCKSPTSAHKHMSGNQQIFMATKLYL